MEGVSASVYKGFRGYWRRRGYERLTGTSRRRKNRVELAGSGSTRRRRFWRIRVAPKLRLKLRFSPKKFFIGLRDLYVKMMLKIASSGVMISDGSNRGFGAGGVGGFGTRPVKEYDERMIVELYKSLVFAQGQLVTRDATRIGGL